MQKYENAELEILESENIDILTDSVINSVHADKTSVFYINIHAVIGILTIT